MANVTIVTFNYILVIEFLFPLNVGVVSPCFHCTVLVHVYRVHTSCFHNGGLHVSTDRAKGADNFLQCILTSMWWSVSKVYLSLLFRYNF